MQGNGNFHGFFTVCTLTQNFFFENTYNVIHILSCWIFPSAHSFTISHHRFLGLSRTSNPFQGISNPGKWWTKIHDFQDTYQPFMYFVQLASQFMIFLSVDKPVSLSQNGLKMYMDASAWYRQSISHTIKQQIN